MFIKYLYKMTEIGEISRLSLSDIWQHEERDFTPWLCENIDKLSSVVGFAISNPENEHLTDNFRVDIVATKGDEEEQKVIIENQYKASNHDHLGKLLAYASTFDAKAAIWIVEKARVEHITAINKLNQSGFECWYYLVEASVIKIDDSKPALVFTVMAAPDAEVTAAALPEGKSLVSKFWAEFLQRCNVQKLSLYNRVNATTDNWLNAGSGKNGIHYSIIATQSTMRINLVLDKNKQWNADTFKYLEENKAQIEALFGDSLEWDWGRPDKASKIIAKELTSGGYRSDKKQWPQIMDEAIDTMRKFENAFKLLIQKI